MNNKTKQYFEDNEGGLYHITTEQTWDLTRNFGFTFTIITREEFRDKLLRGE